MRTNKLDSDWKHDSIGHFPNQTDGDALSERTGSCGGEAASSFPSSCEPESTHGPAPPPVLRPTRRLHKQTDLSDLNAAVTRARLDGPQQNAVTAPLARQNMSAAKTSTRRLDAEDPALTRSFNSQPSRLALRIYYSIKKINILQIVSSILFPPPRCSE